MTNSTNDHRQCTARAWCDTPGPTHDWAHEGEADAPNISATGDGQQIQPYGSGLLVPEVVLRLIEQTQPSSIHPLLSIGISVIVSDDKHAETRLTIDEARLMHVHLTQLLDEVDKTEARDLRQQMPQPTAPLQTGCSAVSWCESGDHPDVHHEGIHTSHVVGLADYDPDSRNGWMGWLWQSDDGPSAGRPHLALRLQLDHEEMEADVDLAHVAMLQWATSTTESEAAVRALTILGGVR